jgi:hypothetical protein
MEYFDKLLSKVTKISLFFNILMGGVIVSAGEK